MRTVLAAVAAVAMSLAFLIAPSAAAADKDEVVRQLADVSFQSGLRWFKKGDYERALVEFSKANAVYPRGSTMRNLALCELKLGKPLDALFHLRAAIRAPDTKPETRELAKQEMADTYALTGHILAHSNNSKATLSVDGEEVVGPEDPVDVLPGHHVVEARLGTRTGKVDVDAKAGAIVTADVSIPEPPPAAVPPSSVPAATPGASANSQPETPLGERPAPFWNARREVGVGVASFGVIALVVGEVFHMQAQTARDRASSLLAGQPPSACNSGAATVSCTALANAQSEQQRDATWSVASWVTGGVALATGAVLVLWPQSSTTRVALEPFATPHGSGLQLRGEF